MGDQANLKLDVCFGLDCVQSLVALRPVFQENPEDLLMGGNVILLRTGYALRIL
jgi:hypothetical protein